MLSVSIRPIRAGRIRVIASFVRFGLRNSLMSIALF